MCPKAELLRRIQLSILDASVEILMSTLLISSPRVFVDVLNDLVKVSEIVYPTSPLTLFNVSMISEELILDDISTGASNDIERATKIARAMVTQYGMSDRIGPMTLGVGQEEVFLGRDLAQSKEYSEETASVIDEEVKSIIDTAYKTAEEILRRNIDKLHAVAGVLLEKEKIDGDEFEAIFND